jgi:hypothetical protein
VNVHMSCTSCKAQAKKRLDPRIRDTSALTEPEGAKMVQNRRLPQRMKRGRLGILRIQMGPTLSVRAPG